MATTAAKQEKLISLGERAMESILGTDEQPPDYSHEIYCPACKRGVLAADESRSGFITIHSAECNRCSFSVSRYYDASAAKEINGRLVAVGKTTLVVHHRSAEARQVDF